MWATIETSATEATKRGSVGAISTLKALHDVGYYENLWTDALHDVGYNRNLCNWGNWSNQEGKCKGHFNPESTAWCGVLWKPLNRCNWDNPDRGEMTITLLQCTVFRITVCQSRLYKRINRSRFSHNINATVAAVQALPKKTASLHRSLVSLTYKRIKRTDHGRSSEGKFQ